jgi:hypothetical protein
MRAGGAVGGAKRACLLHAERAQKKFVKFAFVPLTTRENRIEYGSCGEQACTIGMQLVHPFCW